MIALKQGIFIYLFPTNKLRLSEQINSTRLNQVREMETDISYAILCTPGVSDTIKEDQVKIITGIVRRNTSEATIQLGNSAPFNEGEKAFPDEQLLKRPPSSYQGSDWVIGIEIDPIGSME